MPHVSGGIFCSWRLPRSPPSESVFFPHQPAATSGHGWGHRLAVVSLTSLRRRLSRRSAHRSQLSGFDRRRSRWLTHSTAEGACRSVESEPALLLLSDHASLQILYSIVDTQLTLYIFVILNWSFSFFHRCFQIRAVLFFNSQLFFNSPLCFVPVLFSPCGVG